MIENIQVVGVTSTFGAALLVAYSAVILTCDNTFINNTALLSGGAVSMQGSNVSISGRNYFEGNNAFLSGGAVDVWKSTLEFRGTIPLNCIKCCIRVTLIQN